MAGPTSYTIGYSFSGFQNNAALPAPGLDEELLDIQTFVSAVKDIRRRGGGLNNGIKIFDSLTLALQLMLHPRA